MKTKNILKITVILMSFHFITLNAFSAESVIRLEQILKSCIDDQTFAVVHVDFEKLDIDAFADKAIEMINKQAESEIAQYLQESLSGFQKQANVKVDDLLKAGCKGFFVVFSMYDFPYFFVAFQSGSDQAGLSQQILKIKDDFNIGKLDLYSTDGLILVGLEQTIARLKTVSPVQSEILGKSFQSCGDTTLQAVLFPSSDQRRIMAEMFSRIPFGTGMLDLTPLGTKLHWAALGFNGPPSISLNITIQSQNADDAESVLKFIKDFYALATQNPQVKGFWPHLEQTLKLLTPQRNENQLLLKIDSKTADSIITELITVSLLEIRATATRHTCMTNLKGIGLALMIYANDYDDKFPPDLETLISKAQMSPKGIICTSTKQKDSYVYRGVGLTTSDVPYLITVYDKKGNHKDGRNVLFLDGHVEFVNEEGFIEFIDKDNKYRREKGYSEIPAQ